VLALCLDVYGVTATFIAVKTSNLTIMCVGCKHVVRDKSKTSREETRKEGRLRADGCPERAQWRTQLQNPVKVASYTFPKKCKREVSNGFLRQNPLCVFILEWQSTVSIITLMTRSTCLVCGEDSANVALDAVSQAAGLICCSWLLMMF
jgi:hypothetical protein